jgi:hypothetical protein
MSGGFDEILCALFFLLLLVIVIVNVVSAATGYRLSPPMYALLLALK